MKYRFWAIILLLVAFAYRPAAAQSDKALPYWASIDVDEARMRTGPSTEFPIKWVYKRKYLPVKIIDRLSVWRKVEDPDGDQGWMHVRLLSAERSAIVRGTIAAMREEPQSTAGIAWRAEPGVVGRISDCDTGGWCLFDVAGRRGYVTADAIWGEEAITPAGEK